MKSPVLLIALVICFVIISSCKSVDIISGESSSKEIGPNGGSITSSDGNLTLTFPAGALSSTETITITKIGADQFGPEFEQLQSSYTIGSVYELSPDGLEFDLPVHAEILSAQKFETLNGRTKLDAEILISSRNGVITVLENAGIRRHTDSKVTVYGNLSGFSKLALLNAEYSVSNVTREDIEKNIPPPPGRTFQSVVSITPGIDENSSDTIRKEYGSGLSFLGASNIGEVKSGPQGTLFGTSRKFNFQCTHNGKVSLETRVRFKFSESEVGDILQNIPYEMTMEEVINCLLPEDDDEYDFSILDLNVTYSNTPGGITLTGRYQVDEEIAKNSHLSISFGDGRIETYELNGSENNFSFGHQYNWAGTFDIRVKALGYKKPDTEIEESDYRTDPVRNIATRGLLRNEFINREWTDASSFDDWFENSVTDRIKKRAAFGSGADFPSSITTFDDHLKFNFDNLDGLNEDQPAISLFSVDRFDLGDNSWMYKLNYSTDFTERFGLTPSISYSEFPNEEGSQPLEVDLNLWQAMPIIIKIDELGNPYLVHDPDSFNPNAPTRFIIPSALAENLILYDIDETTVDIPGHTLRIFKDGNGSGTVIASNNGYDIKECGSECSQDYTEGTTVTLVPYPDPGSEFVRFSDNTSLLQASNNAFNILIDDYTTVTATFKKIDDFDSDRNIDDSDLEYNSISLDGTESILGQVTSDGTGLTGVTVEILDESGKTNQTADTNAEGRFRFLNLVKGDYYVDADSEGFDCSIIGREYMNDDLIATHDEVESLRTFVNFECIPADKDPQEDEMISQIPPIGGPVVQDRPWFPGGYTFGVNVGYPIRYTLLGFVEDQEDLSNADVSGFKPMFGIGAEIDLFKKGRWTLSSEFNFGRSGYKTSQTFNDGTQVDGEVGVTNLDASAKFRIAMWSKYNEPLVNNVIQNLKRPVPYFKVGLNTVFNNNKIQFRNSFQENIENIERNHNGYNFVAGIGFDSRISKSIIYSLGVDANFGKADTYISPIIGLGYLKTKF